MEKIVNLFKDEARTSQLYGIDTGATPLSIPNGSGIVPVLGIRLNSAFLDSKLAVIAYTTLSTTNDDYRYLWLMNPTLDVAPTWITPNLNPLNPGTISDVFIGDGTQRISAGNEGIKLVSGYESRRSSELNQYSDRERNVGNKGGTIANELFLCVTELTGTFDCYASLMRDEIM